MKKRIVCLLILLSGCSSPWVYTPAPVETISMQEAAVANGVLQPQNLYFTLISQYQPEQARVVILTELAVKLADLTVSKEQAQVHYQAPKVPNRLISAWVKLVRAHFLVPCPEQKIIHKVGPTGEKFELEVTGGLCL